jgi:L-cysteate sulfo-lyase
MDLFDLDVRLSKLPRSPIGFYPTPFHRLHNLSAVYGVNFFLKREDLAGPGTISGSKTRLSEFILGQALLDGYTHVITQGVYLTNSGLQFAAASRVAGLTPILFLTRDRSRHGELSEYRGNLLLNKIMDVENPREHLLELLSITYYWYIVSLNSGSASGNCRGPNGGLSQRLI